MSSNQPLAYRQDFLNLSRLHPYSLFVLRSSILYIIFLHKSIAISPYYFAICTILGNVNIFLLNRKQNKYKSTTFCYRTPRDFLDNEIISFFITLMKDYLLPRLAEHDGKGNAFHIHGQNLPLNNRLLQAVVQRVRLLKHPVWSTHQSA